MGTTLEKSSAAANAERKADSPAMSCSEVFESENMMSVTSSCGHTAPIEKVMISTDKYKCPVCGLAYHVEHGKPTVLKNGFVIPGDKRIIVDDTGNGQCPQPPPELLERLKSVTQFEQQSRNANQMVGNQFRRAMAKNRGIHTNQ